MSSISLLFHKSCFADFNIIVFGINDLRVFKLARVNDFFRFLRRIRFNFNDLSALEGKGDAVFHTQQSDCWL